VTASVSDKRAWPLSDQDWRDWYFEVGRSHLCLILLAVWDPLGVYDAHEAADEYERYTADALVYLRSEDADGLAGELARIEREWMGVAGRFGPHDERRDVAKRIIALAWASAWLWAGKPKA
jgi:hypothetical protein